MKGRRKDSLDLKVNLGRLKLSVPIVCASGTFGFGVELENLVNFDCVGAVVTKTITLAPRAGNPPPRIYETECGVINSVGLENPGLEIFLKEKLPLMESLNTKFIVSIGGSSVREYQEIVKQLDCKKRVDAFEINLSCPNLKLKRLVSQSQLATYNLVKALRKLTEKPLFAKITPEVTDISKIAKAVEEGGGDGISLVNTFFSMAIDIETKRSYLGNTYGGYSGKAIKPISLYKVWKVARNVGIPVIGGGGIEKSSDAVEFILAGAAAVSLGTVNLVAPNSAEIILRGIKDYMRKKKLKKIDEFKGDVD